MKKVEVYWATTMESSCSEETVIENIGIIPKHKPLLGRVQLSWLEMGIII